MQTRKQKRRAVRASNLNATIGKVAAPLIYPSQTTAHVHADVVASATACSCGECGFKFTSVASVNGQKIAPLCANCGSGKVTAKKLDKAVITETEASLAAVQCKKCDTMQIQAAATAEAMATGYHCVTCGEEQILTPEAPEAPEGEDLIPESPDNEVTQPETVVVSADPAQCADNAESTDDTGATNSDPIVQAPSTVVDPAGPAVDAVTPSDSTTATVPSAAAVAETEEEDPADDEDAFGAETEESEADPADDLSDLGEDETFPEGTDPIGEETSGEGEDDELDFDDEEETSVVDDADSDTTVQFDDAVELDAEDDGEHVQFDLMPEEDQDGAELSFVYVGDKLQAFVNDLHVASLSKQNAGKQADLFNSDVLVRSIVASCRDVGLRKGLQAAGFKIVRVSLPIQALVAKRVKAATAALKAVEAASVKSTATDWQQSIAVALAGLNKNFFVGKTNPLKAGLIAELSTLGVRNPTKLVDKVFAAHGGAFNSAVLEVASDVQGKPLDVRNQLAETLDSTNYMESEDDVEEDEDDEEDSSVTARLNGAGHRPVVARKEQTASTVVASSNGSRVSDILSRTGGSLFS